VAGSALIQEDREVFLRVRASMARRTQVCITLQGYFQHLLRMRHDKSKSALLVVRFFDTIQCHCQISCMVIVFVVAFLSFHFHLLFISIDHGPE
jgi:hypothetical protein